MKKFEKKSAGPLERLRMRSGIYASAVTVLVVVLAVLLNLIVRAVPTKYTEFDLSEAGLYTLSGSSREIAHALTQDVTIYYLAETGSEDAIITKLLDRYASESSHIKWETKDPAVYPTFAAQYGVQSAENGSLILVSGEKSAVLAASDLYDYDYSDYYTTGSYSVTFGGENKLTAAIYRITSGEELHAYYTTNHGEQRLTDTLTDALEGQNLSVSPLDLLTDTIPDDCDLLIIDDLGMEISSSYITATIYNVIDTRITLKKPTIISTNLSMQELEKRYNERFTSRIIGFYDRLIFRGKDIRMKKKLNPQNKQN